MPSISGARYLHRSNGYGDSLNSHSGVQRIYEADHLATFTVGANQGVLWPEDGLRKLRIMQDTTGIWTMRCQLILSQAQVSIVDKQTGEELERFLWSQVADPTALGARDDSDLFGDLLMFTAYEDKSLSDTTAEMHVFQAHGIEARVIAEDMKTSLGGRFSIRPPDDQASDIESRHQLPREIQPPPVTPQLQPIDYRQQNFMAPYGDPVKASEGSRMLQDALDLRDQPNRSEKTELQVRLLNHCFDDIERFVSRLQASAEAQKELERRRAGRTSRHSRRMGEGMLAMRARPPPPGQFMDTFAKFKLAFNLLADLKAYIHDPNAPELVHFLFTPLSLVIEASREPHSRTPDMASKVLSPLLSRKAKELLMHCLTSKEMDLWMSLGDTWTTSRDDWQGTVRPFYPQFSDGWQPAPHQLEVLSPSSLTSPSVPTPHVPTPYPQSQTSLDVQRLTTTARSPERPRPQRYREPSSSVSSRQSSVQRLPRTEFLSAGNTHRSHVSQQRFQGSQPPTLLRERAPFTDDQERFASAVLRNGARCFQVRFDRVGNNPKELSVQRGEALEVLESSKNWWRVRNSSGAEGFVPYTILKPW